MSRPWTRAPVVRSGIPTMISEEERRYLRWLTATRWVDAGHVLEIGPWLGGSTRCLGDGMTASGRRPRHRLFAVDNFVWRPFMAERAALSIAPGDSFEAFFRANVASLGEIVAPVRASLPDEAVVGDPYREEIRDAGSAPLFRWDRDQPIELLFIDGAKSWTGMRHLLSEAADSLVERRALIVCQDYKYWGAYWVPIAIELLGEQLECLDVVGANTVTFRLRGALRKADVERLPAIQDLGVDDGLAALDSAARRLSRRRDPRGAAVVGLARVRFLAHKGRMDAAIASLRESERRWPLPAHDPTLRSARAWLERAAGEPVPRTASLARRGPLPGAARVARRLWARAIALRRAWRGGGESHPRR